MRHDIQAQMFNANNSMTLGNKDLCILVYVYKSDVKTENPGTPRTTFSGFLLNQTMSATLSLYHILGYIF